jgi:dienelactone hydrolase
MWADNKHMGWAIVLAAALLPACAGSDSEPILPAVPNGGFAADVSSPADSAAGNERDGRTPDPGPIPDPGPTPDSGPLTPDSGPPTPDHGLTPDPGPPTPDTTATPPPLFDLTLISDPSTLDCRFDTHRRTFKDGVNLDLWNVSYISYESIDGALRPILIRAFVSRPAGAGSPLPGIVNAHGLGGSADENLATGPAALLRAVVLAYTGPGGGTHPENTSEGLPAGHEEGRRMFDTVPDPRGSWFWAHAVAAMRGLTCLASRPEVDSRRLGMTGFSGGGVATLISAAVDPRVLAAVPLSGTLDWDEAVRSPDAWQHSLLSEAGLSTASAEWTALVEALDSSTLFEGSTANVLMVNGSTDEFFPLTAHLKTFSAISGGVRRTSIAANFDHGCYMLTGIEPADQIEKRADLRARGGQQMWFGHFFGTDSDFSRLPETPTFDLSPQGLATVVSAVVDESSSSLKVEEVKIWWSNDDSFLYGSVALDRHGPGLYGKLALFPTAANTVAFVDVLYKTKDLILPTRFSLSSTPRVPQGLVPHIRAIPEGGSSEMCL